MKNQFSLKIKTPCHENFDGFSPTPNGGFCDACEKEVIDFTAMNSAAILDYFKSDATENTCGRFNSSQLKTYDTNTQQRKHLNILSGMGFAFLSLVSLCEVQAQNANPQTEGLDADPSKLQVNLNQTSNIVKGNVNENGIPLPGATVLLEGTTVGVSTDFDGNFEFPQKLKTGDVLVFSYIGMNSKKVVIQNDNALLKISLDVNLQMDSCILLGKVAVEAVYNSKQK